jgi:hypothetical protein
MDPPGIARDTALVDHAIQVVRAMNVANQFIKGSPTAEAGYTKYYARIGLTADHHGIVAAFTIAMIPALIGPGTAGQMSMMVCKSASATTGSQGAADAFTAGEFEIC